MGEVLTRVLSTLAARFAGTPARVMVAGGAVRDFVLGLPPRDIDLLIESELRDETEILRVLALLSGMEPVVFDRRPPATHRVVVEGVVVDTSFCRPGALVGALERRDFTLNAMALPLAFAVPALE